MGLFKKVTITGDKEVDRKLRALEPRIRKKVQRDAIKRAAKNIIVPAAKALAPEDTGELAASIKAKANRRSRSSVGYTIATTNYNDQGKFYGGFPEFGTKHQEASPFLRPAGYGNEDRIRQEVISDIREQLAKL